MNFFETLELLTGITRLSNQNKNGIDKNMSEESKKMEKFLEYTKLLDGKENSEAQVFLDRLFQAFGHDGYKEAGATMEYRIKKESGRGTGFADLVWKPYILLEMKKRGENLYHHYQQAFDYWIRTVPNRPRYVVLCNFDEFWIYDFDKQIDQPVDKVNIEELPKRFTALNFLFSGEHEPVFENDRAAVSEKVAKKVAQLFHLMISRGIERVECQQFVLQLVFSMFAESVDLLPKSLIYNIVRDCLEKDQCAYDLFGALFKQMNQEEGASGGRFKGVQYFNGGLFEKVKPLDLEIEELKLIGGKEGIATYDWSKVNPAIFGTIFQGSMDANRRHAAGAHYTSEADIMRIVKPTIVRPWMHRIRSAKSKDDLIKLRKELVQYKVLDPACGSGNFLYLAYRELVRVEIALLAKLREKLSAKKFLQEAKAVSLISPHQFYGIDCDLFGVELAKVSLMLAKKLALDEAIDVFKTILQEELSLLQDDVLPLDNLNTNFIHGDALFEEWPEVDVIIGNPPFQSKNKIIKELGRPYVNKVREHFKGEIPALADYCVYWFRKTHNFLKQNQRAGLVGTKTITKNYSKIGGLQYIVENGGTIIEAVSSQVWSGDANVHVSIVNWIKGEEAGEKLLLRQVGSSPNSPWEEKVIEEIGPSLSFETEVSSAGEIHANSVPKYHFQGQTVKGNGFLLDEKDALKILEKFPDSAQYLHPFLITDNLTGTKSGLPTRYVIDFGDASIEIAQKCKPLFEHLRVYVLPEREIAAQEEERRNEEARQIDSSATIRNDHSRALDRWWQLYRPRTELISKIENLNRYIVSGRVTMNPFFEFISPEIRPGDSLIAYVLEDDYSFGILQSDLHRMWIDARAGALAAATRNTPNSVFKSFPWPQSATKTDVQNVAEAAVNFRKTRRDVQIKNEMSFRELANSLKLPGRSIVKDAHHALDVAVRNAYGLNKSQDSLMYLLNLNLSLIEKEAKGETVIGPGLPPNIKNKAKFISKDCLRMSTRC